MEFKILCANKITKTKLCELPAKSSVLERPYYCLLRSNKCKIFTLIRFFSFTYKKRPLVSSENPGAQMLAVIRMTFDSSMYVRPK